MMTKVLWLSTVACVLACFACASDKTAKSAVPTQAATSEGAGATAGAGSPAGSGGDDDAASAPLVMRTDEFSVEAGQERYLCFTKTLDEDAVIGAYSHAAQPFVHHVVFVRTLVPEPDGFSECDTLFRMTWDPLFISGAGDSTLQFPSDAGHKLTKGTQLLVQMHLLNASDQAVKGTVEVQMHRSTVQNPRPVSTYVLGTTSLHLPPNQASDVQENCTMKEAVHMIAAFPHEHLLGTKLQVEAGPSSDALKTVFMRDPYSFDDQHTENVDIQLQAGDVTRVTCSYLNTDSQEVTFGESTHNEMCFFIGFAIDREALSTCLGQPPDGPDGMHMQ